MFIEAIHNSPKPETTQKPINNRKMEQIIGWCNKNTDKPLKHRSEHKQHALYNTIPVTFRTGRIDP
jgi:hypothetical protein